MGASVPHETWSIFDLRVNGERIFMTATHVQRVPLEQRDRATTKSGEVYAECDFSAADLRSYLRQAQSATEPATPTVEPDTKPDTTPDTTPVPRPDEAPEHVPGTQPTPDADPVPDQCPIRRS